MKWQTNSHNAHFVLFLFLHLSVLDGYNTGCLFFCCRIMSRNYMSKNDELRRGDSLVSNNEKYKVIFQVSKPDFVFAVETFIKMHTSFTILSKSKIILMVIFCTVGGWKLCHLYGREAYLGFRHLGIRWFPPVPAE